MDLYTRFFEGVRELEGRLAIDAAVPPLSLVGPERMREQLREGLPLLPLVPPAIPVEHYFGTLGEYRALLARHAPELGVELAAQEAALLGASAEVRGRLFRALLHGDNEAVFVCAEELGISPERLYFLGELALRPYLAVYAERLESVLGDFTGYNGGRCPVCARQAHLGRIDADNVKHLHCPGCEATWRTGRVGCTNCGCTEPSKLGFFTVEGNDEYRVEHCGECGHYLKVINQRIRVRKLDLLVVDAATYHLDQLAVAEGYRKGGRELVAQ